MYDSHSSTLAFFFFVIAQCPFRFFFCSTPPGLFLMLSGSFFSCCFRLHITSKKIILRIQLMQRFAFPLFSLHFPHFLHFINAQVRSQKVFIVIDEYAAVSSNLAFIVFAQVSRGMPGSFFLECQPALSALWTFILPRYTLMHIDAELEMF